MNGIIPSKRERAKMKNRDRRFVEEAG